MTADTALMIIFIMFGIFIYILIAGGIYNNVFEGTVFEFLKNATNMNMLGIAICGLLPVIVFAPIEIGIWFYRFIYWLFQGVWE